MVVVARERREEKIFLGIFLDVNLIALNHGNMSCLVNIQCFYNKANVNITFITVSLNNCFEFESPWSKIMRTKAATTLTNATLSFVKLFGHQSTERRIMR